MDHPHPPKRKITQVRLLGTLPVTPSAAMAGLFRSEFALNCSWVSLSFA